MGGRLSTATKVSGPSMAILSLIMVKLVHCRELLEDAGKVTWLVAATKSSDSTLVQKLWKLQSRQVLCERERSRRRNVNE